MTKSKRSKCPECRLKHTRKYATPLGIRMIGNCPLYSPGMSVEQENKLFDSYLRHCERENDMARGK